jgi:triacylglycerol lipase
MNKIEMMPFPAQAHLFAKLSELAYKDIKEVEETFAQLGFIAHYFDVNGSQAYLLKNEHDLVVVCRGTQPTEFADIKSDLNAVMVRSSTGIGHVHQGFKESVDNIWPELEEQLKVFGKTRTIWCTGHSLGAAMATLLAYRLQRTEDCPNPKALFTYGSPKVGNRKYVKQIEEPHENDPVEWKWAWVTYKIPEERVVAMKNLGIYMRPMNTATLLL